MIKTNINIFNDSELLEILSDLEHERWSHWQKHLHKLCIENKDGSLTIPKDKIIYWQKLFGTPYKDLLEEVKEQDKIQARKTIRIIKKYITDKK